MKGPVPVTALGLPALHKPELGAEYAPTPFAEPQTPSTFLLAIQFSVVPSPAGIELHVQSQPVAVVETAVAVPVAHRFGLDGAV